MSTIRRQETNLDELLMALLCAQVEVFAQQFAPAPAQYSRFQAQLFEKLAHKCKTEAKKYMRFSFVVLNDLAEKEP
jgi:hypothetical protein